MVDAEGAEFWETHDFASGLLGIVTAAVKGDRPDLGTNEKVDLHSDAARAGAGAQPPALSNRG